MNKHNTRYNIIWKCFYVVFFFYLFTFVHVERMAKQMHDRPEPIMVSYNSILNKNKHKQRYDKCVYKYVYIVFILVSITPSWNGVVAAQDT